MFDSENGIDYESIIELLIWRCSLLWPWQVVPTSCGACKLWRLYPAEGLNIFSLSVKLDISENHASSGLVNSAQPCSLAYWN